MNILVTGAAGFVGSHLCKRLLDEGHFVLGLDNFSTGRERNLSGLIESSQFAFERADVSDPLPSLIRNRMKWDWVFHFASPASPPKYQRLSIETLRVNAEGTRHLLELCHQQDANFFYASTSEVYGDPLVHPQPEDYFGNVNPIGGRSMYDEAKRYGEAMTYAVHRRDRVSVRVIRIFNTYGPHMDPEDGRVVTNFIMQGLRNEPMTLYGDGLQTRSFQYVSDLIEGIHRLMGVEETRPVNLGNPNEFTMIELAELVCQKLGIPKNFVYRDLPENDPKLRRPDITRAKAVLGWAPKVLLKEGLDQTIEDLRRYTRL